MKILSIFLFVILCNVLVVSADEHLQPIDTLRVMTYNIHTGVGVDGVFDLTRIAKLITEHKIDIAGLQEIDQGVERTDRVNTMEILSELTGMQAVFGKAIQFQGGEYGNGILSRFPVIEKRNYAYRFTQSDEHRAMLYVFIQYEQDTLLVMNTHLDHRPDDAERMKSVAEILSVASEYKNTPMFLTGDINDIPDSRVVAKVKQRFHDVWEETGKGTGYTYHTEDLNKRIDYIFYAEPENEDIAGIYIRPINAFTIQTHASDHLPVVAEFEVYVR